VGCRKLGFPIGENLPGYFRYSRRFARAHFAHEAVSAAGDSLNKSRIGGGIAQDFPNLVYRGVQAVVKIYKRVGRPETLAQILSSDNAASAFEKQHQDGKRLVLKTYPATLLAKFSQIQVSFKNAKAEDPELACGIR